MSDRKEYKKRWYLENRERCIKLQKKWHTEHREHVRQRGVEYYIKNRERCKQRVRVQKSKGQLGRSNNKEYAKNYRIQHRDILLANHRRKSDIWLIWARFYLGDQCVVCEKKYSLHFHHKIPKNKLFSISMGISRSPEIFSTELNKCVLVCKSCHIKIHK